MRICRCVPAQPRTTAPVLPGPRPPESSQRATGGRTWSQDGLRRVFHPGSRELLLPFPPRASEAALADAVRFARERGCRTVGCWLSGTAPTPALDARLTAHRFAPGWRPHWMALALDRAVAVEHDERVAEADAVPEWGAYGQGLLALTRGRRRAWLVVAREQGGLAGFCWLHRRGGRSDVAGLFDLVVFDAFRRRGLGRALTAAACARAAALGCRWVTLNATVEGERVYRALSFRSLGHGRTWWLHLDSGP
jgi:GNAT superfamily N-acetyltransferase